MRQTRRFGVNVLAEHHEQFAMRATPAGANRFDGLDWSPGPGGMPLLPDALATLECRIAAEHPAGDHSIVIGRVSNLRISPDPAPLVFFAGTFIAVQEQRRRGGSAWSERGRVGPVRACDQSSKQRPGKELTRGGPDRSVTRFGRVAATPT
jgi:flavin reductase (DIM6/NTAB) family NADH-FMN oxidoreductase RutF